MLLVWNDGKVSGRRLKVCNNSRLRVAQALRSEPRGCTNLG